MNGGERPKQGPPWTPAAAPVLALWLGFLAELAAGLEPATRCLRKPCGPLPPPPGRCHPLPGAAVLPATAPISARPASRLVPPSGGACHRVGGTDGGGVSGPGAASRIAPAAPRAAATATSARAGPGLRPGAGRVARRHPEHPGRR